MSQNDETAAVTTEQVPESAEVPVEKKAEESAEKTIKPDAQPASLPEQSSDISHQKNEAENESSQKRKTSWGSRSRHNASSDNASSEDKSQDGKPSRVMISRRGGPRNADTQELTGFLDTTLDGHAVIREHFGQSKKDAYLSMAVVRRLNLRPGDVVTGMAREPRETDRYWGMQEITKVNGAEVHDLKRRTRFEDLVAVYPDEKIRLETGPDPLSTRLIDLVAPIGKGQRGLIVSPPKAGKTSILKEMATGVAANEPEAHLMAVLIGERPEEVTDIRRHIERITNGKGEVAASNFDEHATEQTRVAEVALERAKRLVEVGRDVVILLDSITRLARAYNLAMPTSGRTLSGGFDPSALYPPKRFFGAARNFEGPGSLTIIGTALIDTGSRMDDLVYEEFKGTGNMELHLDRRLAERRIYPAINLQRSGTRRDDLLFDHQDYQSVLTLHRMIDMLGEEERTGIVVQRMKNTKTNKEFLASLKEG